MIFLADDEFTDARVNQSLRRWGVANDLALVKRQDAGNIAFDDFHIMFDEQHRRLVLAQGLHDDVHQAEFLFDRDAGGWLIEHQDGRFADRRHGNIQQLADALWQGRGKSVAVLRDLIALQVAVHPGGAGIVQKGREQAQPGCLGNGIGHQKIVEHGFGEEDLGYLKRPGNAQRGNIPRRQPHDAAAGKFYLARCRL